MTGPKEVRDEDLDASCFDDELHEATYGYPLNKTHEVYDYEDAEDESHDG